jgi:hypothetical protein
MFSARFEHDEYGKPIPGGAQDILVAFTLNQGRRAEDKPLQMRVRDDATGQWHTHDLRTPKAAEANARELGLHRDRVTGADLLFVAAFPDLLGLIVGVYDSTAPGRIRWADKAELSATGRRAGKWFGMATVGPQPKWTKVVQFPRGVGDEGGAGAAMRCVVS